MISYDEMPEDNTELANIEIDFPLLMSNTAESCPIRMAEIVDYLRVESPDYDAIQATQLHFLRTAQVAEKGYWIWSFEESDGQICYVTVSITPNRSANISYDDNYFGLSPEQFMLGDYHNVF
jgi:hypothetical protein